MKYTIKSNKPVSKIPEVGQVWRHKGYTYVYIRISDSIGKLYYPTANDCFYSVSLASGEIALTRKDCESIEISHNTVEFEF